MEVRLLGPLELVVDGHDVTPSRPKHRALLALLLLRANEIVATDELAEALWGGRPPQTARTALHGHVSALRKALGEEVIETCPGGYRLRLPAERTDVGRFEALVAEARKQGDAASRAGLLQAALDLFRGEPLPEFRFEDFARGELARLEELRLAALEERIEADLELGKHAELLPELERLVAANPLRERPRGQLMVALYRTGRQAEALSVYRKGRRALADQLGLDPGPALRDLEQRILSHDPLLAAPAPPSRPAQHPARQERRVVTVLVCDLVGLSATSQQVDPEDLRALHRPYLERVRAELESFGGTVERSVGDAVMALFGAPVAHEDDAERAVRAALAVLDEISSDVELRVVVNTGEALVTLDAEPASGEPHVSGDVVNTATRLQAFVPPNGILVGESTHRATRSVIDYRPSDPVRPSEAARPVPVWEALGARSPPRTPRSYDTPFLGRARELDALLDALARARERREPGLVTVVGVPGIGKTRLLAELQSRLDGDVLVRQGRSLPYGDGVPFWALGEVVKAHAGVLETDDAARAAAKLEWVAGEATANAAERGWVLRHLRRLLGIAAEGPAAEGEAFAAWRQFFEGIAERAPLLLAVEDLHWADDGLLDFLDELVEEVASVPLLVVATARPELLERRPAWGGGKPNATSISLGPLAQEDTGHLLASLLEGEGLSAHAEQRLLARVEGNPLYAEEYARLIVERGVGSDLPTPESLHALIAARLDALSPPEKTLTQEAAVVGEVFWADSLAAIGERPRAAVDELLRVLARRQFLRRQRHSSVEGQAEYAFHHVLVRDVAYGQIPRAERGRKHRLAAEWIEALGRREDHAELLAHHYRRALELAQTAGDETYDLRDRAHRACRDAGERAAALGAMHAAAGHFEAALEFLPGDHSDRPELLLRLGRALLFADVTGEDVLLEAAEASAAAGDRLTAARAEALLGTLNQEEGRGELARERLAKARVIAEGLPTSREKGEILAEVARSSMMAVESEEAVRVGSLALEIAEQLGLDELRAHALSSIGPARCALGDAERGIRDLERAIAIASEINSLEAVRGYGNLGQMLANAGDLARASEMRAEAQRLGERYGARWYLRWLRFDELEELYFAGDWDGVLHRTDELSDERSFNATVVFQIRAWVRLAHGDGGGATSDAARSLELARESNDAQVLLPALATASAVNVSTGHTSEAAGRIDELLPLVRAFGSPTAPFLLPALALALERLARGNELLELAANTQPTPWWEAGCAYAVGDFHRAAETYAQIGSRPDEAWARLRAAETLMADGRNGDAD
jgi:DNA-binding SARP family transcriptional activator